MAKRLTILVLALWLPGSLAALELYAGGAVGEKVTQGALGLPFEELGVEALDPSAKIYGGFGLGRHLAIEATYYDFGVRICCPRLADAGFNTRLDGYSAAAVGRWPFDRLQLFGKVGILVWEETGEELTFAGPRPIAADGSDLLVGVGAAVGLIEHLAVRAEWEAFDLGDASADAVWIAVEVRF